MTSNLTTGRSMPENTLFTAESVLNRLRFIRDKRQEYFICISLGINGQIIRRRTVTIGLLTQGIVHPREVFAGPLKDRAAAVIIAHNHPSGCCDPSDADIDATQQLVAAGRILGLPVHDHIIVARNGLFSFRAHLLIQ